ncbi:MAG: sigma 54-interacting transcriptional regulator [Deltaproteobacteria bacterium]|nr:sigma 54-interacting transcriptional regulator [Deltaproteobacteria bacterium]
MGTLEPQAASELRGRLKWFLLGRVAVISCFFAIVAASYLQSARERYDVPVQQILLAVAATYAFSAVSALMLVHTQRLRRFAFVQIAFDVLLITGVIYLTGGVASPFSFLYSLPIINAAGLLFGEGASFAAIAAAIAYDGLLVGLTLGSAQAGASLDLHVGLRIATTNLTFGMIAFLSSVLTRRLDDAERQLREKQAERDHLALLQDTLSRTIHSGLLTTDPEGRITSADATAGEMIGAAPGELIGRDLGAVFPPLKLTPAARLAFLQSSAASEPVEFNHPDENGGAGHLRCVAAPLASTFGHPIGALYVLQNVTALKELTDETPPDADVEELAARVALDAGGDLAEAPDGLYGVSPAIAKLRELIDRVAGSDATVLVTGESGTGKEVVARAMHARGPRRDKRFVAINCGAIPENLIESELFGHVRGAFTGAVADRPGCFRAADGGTLFLDEIGELPLHLQVKLLRVLQERTFRPVGSEANVAVDVRIIAATNRDLSAQVKAGRFREDLFYRLNVITIDLPPLRERREDIPLLIRHFLRQFSEMHGRRVSRFSVGAGRLLLQHHYPGNIRELENIVEHAVALCDGETAAEDHLPPYLTGQMPGRAPATPQAATIDVIQPLAIEARATNGHAAPPPRVAAPSEPVDLEADLAAYEKAILLRALDQAGGVKKRAAELLGINYRSLRHRLQKYGLSDAYDDPTPIQP